MLTTMPAASAQHDEQFSCRDVIFLDDDRMFLSALQRVLRPQRQVWNMQFFNEAEPALEAASRFEHVLFVTDWMMAGMDGPEVCRRLREQEAGDGHCSRYIIMLTGRHEASDHIAGLECADDFIQKPFDTGILEARIRVGFRMLSLQERLAASHRRLLEVATTDPLTGALNRRQGLVVIGSELERVQRGQGDLSVILIDLDKYKSVNDTYGHAAGDLVLVEVVRELKRASRRYDSVVRWGGDELLVICPSTGANDGIEVAERFRRAIAAQVFTPDEATRFQITGTFGVATAEAGRQITAEDLVARADEAMYKVKSGGGNGVAGLTIGVEQAPRCA